MPKCASYKLRAAGLINNTFSGWRANECCLLLKLADIWFYQDRLST